MSRIATPKYERVKQDLINQITDGRYPIGGPFPPESELLQRFDVSRPTLVRSLQELVREGYLTRRQGQGTFVADYRLKQENRRLPLFVSDYTAKLSGSARQVLLRILSGIEAALGDHRSLLSLHQAPQETLDEPTQRLLTELNPRVALIVESDFNLELVETLREAGCRIITLNQPTTSDCVYIDQQHGAYLATKHLLARGCRRIAMLNGPLDAYWGFAARQRGYTQALAEYGLAPDSTLERQDADPIDAEAGRRMMASLLRSGVDFDGVVGASDSKAIGAMYAAREAGRRIPEDLKIVGIDNTIADQTDPALSAVDMPFEQVGKQAALRAMQLLDTPADQLSPAQTILLQTSLVRRAST